MTDGRPDRRSTACSIWAQNGATTNYRITWIMSKPPKTTNLNFSEFDRRSTARSIARPSVSTAGSALRAASGRRPIDHRPVERSTVNEPRRPGGGGAAYKPGGGLEAGRRA